jgi:hypothetical protein
MGITLLPADRSHAVIMCAKKKQPKRVKLRGEDRCRKGETEVLLDADAVGNAQALVVRDADGAFVGTMTSISGTADAPVDSVEEDGGGGVPPRQVWLRIAGRPYLVRVSPDGFASRSGPLPFAYESRDCSGPPLLRPVESTFEIRELLVQDLTGYYPANTNVRLAHSAISGFRSVGTCRQVGGTYDPVRQICCRSVDDPDPFPFGPRFPFPAGDVATVDLGALGFTPPFSAELEGRFPDLP